MSNYSRAFSIYTKWTIWEVVWGDFLSVLSSLFCTQIICHWFFAVNWKQIIIRIFHMISRVKLVDMHEWWLFEGRYWRRTHSMCARIRICGCVCVIRDGVMLSSTMYSHTNRQVFGRRFLLLQSAWYVICKRFSPNC